MSPSRSQANEITSERTLTLHPETSKLAEVRRFVEEVGNEAVLDRERVFDLKVAVSEACANAIEHAGVDSAQLEVTARMNSERLTFTITDNGVFRPPLHCREAGQARGLGLPLMVALTDEVSFSRSPRGGTTVSLSMVLSRSGSSSAA